MPPITSFSITKNEESKSPNEPRMALSFSSDKDSVSIIVNCKDQEQSCDDSSQQKVEMQKSNNSDISDQPRPKTRKQLQREYGNSRIL